MDIRTPDDGGQPLGFIFQEIARSLRRTTGDVEPCSAMRAFTLSLRQRR